MHEDPKGASQPFRFEAVPALFWDSSFVRQGGAPATCAQEPGPIVENESSGCPLSLGEAESLESVTGPGGRLGGSFWSVLVLARSERLD